VPRATRLRSRHGCSLATASISVLLVAIAIAVVAAIPYTLIRARRQTERQAEGARLRRSEARFRSLVLRSSDVTLVVDAASMIRFASPAVERMFGYEVESVLGLSLTSLLHPDDRAAATEYLARIREGSEESQGVSTVWRVQHREGSLRHAESTAALLDDDLPAGAIVLNSRDITDRVTLEAKLIHQAFHDALTGLANRALFRDRVEMALARELRGNGGVAVVFLDLDEFKTVNDSLGHDTGDQLLCSAAARLLNATRGCDTVARLGGDEFAVLLDNVRGMDDVIVVVERIIGALRQPFGLGAREVRIGASIGIAWATDGQGADELLRNADVAMYRAKRGGRGGYQIFAPEMHSEVVERLELEGDLRRAVEKLSRREHEFGLVYQPIVDLESERVIGVEALVRWHHPMRGQIPPAVFIPLAEETGLVSILGRWILTEACREVASWRDRGPVDGEHMPQSGNDIEPVVTVNVSGAQLRERTFVSEVSEALALSRLSPDRLVIEVTESVIMRDSNTVLSTLADLRELGVRLAIDDFGTGYSALSYLHRFPVDILKIDKSFIDGVAEGGNGAALTRIILALADLLSLRTFAKGVEQSDQRQHLRALGCGYGQGYLFARPLPPADAETLFHRPTAPQLTQ
jgi:diguanylate cyclase (GGDEF)-like protein/PAS domain S-box-containing protein